MLEWKPYTSASAPRTKGNYLVRDEDNNLMVMYHDGSMFEIQIATSSAPTCTNGQAYQEDIYEVWSVSEMDLASDIVEWCELPCES